MTGLTVLRPWYLLLLLAGAAGFVAAWWRWRPPLSPGRSRLSLAVRLLVLAVLVMALAGVQASRTPERRAVVAVADLSDSARAGSDETAAAVRQLLATKGPDDLFGVVSFGRTAQVEVPPSRRPIFDGFQTRPDGTYTDLGGALQLAANLIPDGYARQVVLLSDGRQNLGDAAEAVSGLRGRSVRVDVLPIGGPPGAEALVLALEAPSQLRVGESLTATARLRATAPAGGSIAFEVDGRQVEDRKVEVPGGVSAQAITVPPLEAGVHRLRVALSAEPDGYSQNDVAEAVVRVVGPPVVLVLEGAPGAGANVLAALAAAGMRVEVRAAEQAPGTVGAYTGYDATVIVDAPAPAFPPGAMAAIAASVRDLGRGLVAFGGARSYGPGDWKGTPLEEALPVRMEAPQPKQRPAVAVALVLETMESELGDGVALGAAEAVVDQLTPDDELTVVRMGQPGARGLSEVVLPLTRPVDKPAIKQAIRDVKLGDPLGYGQSLSLGFDTVLPSTAATKHAIILGDGDAAEDIGTYGPLFGRAEAEGIIVTSLGIDTHSDATFMAHMRSIAELGGGRFYQADTAADVPQILLDSTRSALRPWYEQARFFPQVTSAGDLLDGVPLDAFPELGGYVVTTAKPTADVLLASPRRDPVLAAGQFGLGRSVAWTSDVTGRWTSGLLGSPVAAALFGRMVAWSLPSGSGEGLRLDAVAKGDGLDVAVSGPDRGGELSVTAVAPDGAITSHPLPPVGPGRWQGVLPAGEVGTYVLRGVLRRDGAPVGDVEVSVAVPYPPEFLELGRNDGLLGALAGQGGTLLTEAAAAWSQRPLPLRVTSPLFWLLLWLAAVLWPLDIALRRLTTNPFRLGAVRRERADRRRAREERAATTSLAGLVRGVEAARQARPSAPEDEDRAEEVDGVPVEP